MVWTHFTRDLARIPFHRLFNTDAKKNKTNNISKNWQKLSFQQNCYLATPRPTLVHYSRRQFSPTDVSNLNLFSTRRSRGAWQWQIISTDLCRYQWNIKHNINKYQWNDFPDIAERLICKNILKGKKEISRRWDISERSS